MRLLVDDVVDSVRINDLDSGMAAFWRAVFTETDELCRRVNTARVSVPAWRRHRNVYLNLSEHDEITLGFATLFLNRCNRSGILTARPIGGLDQAGTWKIDARFNRGELAARIRYLGDFRHRVVVSQVDARALLKALDGDSESTLVYIDPPYIGQGDGLYLDKLSYSDHLDLATQLH